MLVVQLKKIDYSTIASEIKKKRTDQNHDKYITALEFNKLNAENFAARLKQVTLLAKTDFNDRLLSLNRKISPNKTKHVLVENEFKKLRRLGSIYFKGKSYFKKIVHKIIQCFSQFTDISKGLVVLVLVIIFMFGNLKDCVMKILQILLQLIINLLNSQLSFFGTKTRVEFSGSCFKTKLHMIMEKQ